MSFNVFLRKNTFSPNFSSRRLKGSKSTSLNYCLDLLKKNDHENFLCTLLLPNSVRSAAIAIRAFNAEVANAAAASKDARIALMRLKFWQETIDRIYDKIPPNQPVAIELSRAIAAHDLKKRQFLRLVKAREKQLDKPCFSSLEEMEAYSEETVSPVLYLILEAGGIKDVNADHAASHIGKAQGLSILLRATGSLGGSWGLPKDLLQSADLDVSKGLSPNSDQSRDITYKIASRAMAHLNKARSLRSALPKGSSVYLLPAVSTDNYLLRLKDTGFDLFCPFLNERSARLGLSLFWAKLKRTY